MPVHDWTRVDAGIFHSFHGTWIGELVIALNSGVLQPDYYALGEQIAGGIGPDVLTLRVPTSEGNGAPEVIQGTVAVAETPPKVQLTVQSEAEEYAHKQRTLVIHHKSDHRIIAMIEILSQGNKSNKHGIRDFLDKAIAAVAQGIHLLLIDLYPPGPRDPQGIHGLIWEKLSGNPHQQPTDKPLTLVAYAAGPVKNAYVEPIAVGSNLPDMPLFLTPDLYVNVPLEATHQAAYAGVPRFYREIIEG